MSSLGGFTQPSTNTTSKSYRLYENNEYLCNEFLCMCNKRVQEIWILWHKHTLITAPGLSLRLLSLISCGSEAMIVLLEMRRGLKEGEVYVVSLKEKEEDNGWYGLHSRRLKGRIVLYRAISAQNQKQSHIWDSIKYPYKIKKVPSNANKILHSLWWLWDVVIFLMY